MKQHYDEVGRLLDEDADENKELERIQVKNASQQLYLKYFTLINQIDDWITTACTDGKENSRKQQELHDKLENTDLKKLLNETSEMNAIISAGQFNMHKKDVNDRMSSLAFKMEKVYNLDKKKGPASEVYRYFKSTFEINDI